MAFLLFIASIVFFVWPISAIKGKDKKLWVTELKACGGTILFLIFIIISIGIGSISFGSGVWDGIINAFDGLFYMFICICTVAVLLLEFLLSLLLGLSLFRKLKE